MKYIIKTFGCQQNHADSERIEQSFAARGITPAHSYEEANYVIINTCMIRESAENRVYGLVNNLGLLKTEKERHNEFFKIIVTGCMVGMALRDGTGVFLKKIREAMPAADEFLPVEEIGFDIEPVRQSAQHAWVPIANGCNNFCTFCVVPFTRGREISRPFHEIIHECEQLKKKGFTSVTLLGQNVNSYGSDLLLGESNIQTQRDLEKTYFSDSKTLTNPRVKISFKLNGKAIEPIYVKHLGRFRIPTLFPYLLEAVARLGFEKVDFYSSNPWDFSDELIDVIARNKNITRDLHIPVQSGDTEVLKRMNRWYSSEDYRALVGKIKSKIPEVRIGTDIIVGFPGETDAEFENTVRLAKDIGFSKAYLAMYSQRPLTSATKLMKDSVPHPIKKKRWKVLEELINLPNLSAASARS